MSDHYELITLRDKLADVQSENDALIKALDKEEQTVVALEQRIADLERHNELLRAVAEAAEWNGTFDGERGWCPLCGAYGDAINHYKSCLYQAAIDGGALEVE